MISQYCCVCDLNVSSNKCSFWEHECPCNCSPPAGLLQSVAVEALQVCCLLLPPANRRKLQLLMRLMAKVCANPSLPALNDTIGARTLVIHSPPQIDEISDSL